MQKLFLIRNLTQKKYLSKSRKGGNTLSEDTPIVYKNRLLAEKSYRDFIMKNREFYNDSWQIRICSLTIVDSQDLD